MCVAKLPIGAVLRTRTMAPTREFIPEAGAMMAVVQTAMLAGMPFTGLRDAILTHSTMAEGLNTLLSGVPARAVA